MIKQLENYKKDFIVIRKKPSNKKSKKGKTHKNNKSLSESLCCQFSNTEDCVCNVHVFKLRPYTYEFLRAIFPFFELVVFTRMHYKILEHIIDHIESYLNKPVREIINNYHRDIREKKITDFSRVKKLPEIKVYF
jgi:hypothetical protein